MNHEITKSINGNSKANEKQIIESAFDSIIKKDDTRNGKNDKKDIVAFKNVLIFRLVMISMDMMLEHATMIIIVVTKSLEKFG